jgi:hypothetical protein
MTLGAQPKKEPIANDWEVVNPLNPLGGASTIDPLNPLGQPAASANPAPIIIKKEAPLDPLLPLPTSPKNDFIR